MSFEILYGIENLKEIETALSICFDTETLALQPEKGKLRLLQLGCAVREAVVVIDCFDLDQSDWDRLRRFFSNGDRFWLAHNAVFDLGWLQEHGIYPRGRVGCTMLASRLLTNGIANTKHGLANVVKRYLKLDLDKEQQASDWGNPELSKEQIEYAVNDVAALMDLDPIIDGLLEDHQLKLAYTLECRALPAMAQMWRTGLPWNAKNLEQRKVDYEHDIKELGKDFLRLLDEALPEDQKLPRDEDGSFNLRAKDEGKIRDGTKKYKGFNLNSPKQLVEKLEAVLGKTPVDAKGKPSASKQALSAYVADHEAVQVYLAWKKAEKRRQMITSIQEKMDSKGFVRASYMQLGAESGRMSCIKPNNQQIPRDKQFRNCVEAPDGWVLVDADFGQMELRLAAAVAQDERMTRAFQAGEDPHDFTAHTLGCERQIAKSANFGLLYGSGATGLRNYAGGSGIIMTLEEATAIRNKWLEKFEGIWRWQRANAEEADKKKPGILAETRIPVSGMRRYLQGDMNRLTVRCNTPIQGAGAAILKCALGSLWPLVKAAGEDKVRIAAAVHDEILLLVREDAAERWAATLKRVMEEAEARWLGDIPALAEVSIGKTWDEAH